MACTVTRTTPKSRACRARIARTACACRAHSVRMSRAQRAHVARTACACRAHSVRMSRAQRAHVARTACTCRAHSVPCRAWWACAGRNTPRKPAPCHDTKTRSRRQMTTRYPESGRDIKSVSRHHFSHPTATHVATSIPGRDPKTPLSISMTGHDPSRLFQSHTVATPKVCRDTTQANPDRDTKLMLRH